MLTHIVIWKYRDDVEQFAREEHVNLLRNLKNLVPGIQSLSVGFDTLFLPRSYDTGLVATFDDADALNAYNDHPTHQEVAAMGKEIAAHVVSVDFMD